MIRIWLSVFGFAWNAISPPGDQDAKLSSAVWFGIPVAFKDDQSSPLDGGQGAWTAAGLPLSTEPVDRPPGQLTLNLRPELIADRAEVYASIDEPGD